MIANRDRISHRHGILGDGFSHAHDIDFLEAHLADASGPFHVSSLDLAGNEQAGG
jgi:hypothetical protein